MCGHISKRVDKERKKNSWRLKVCHEIVSSLEKKVEMQERCSSGTVARSVMRDLMVLALRLGLGSRQVHRRSLHRDGLHTLPTISKGPWAMDKLWAWPENWKRL